MESMMMSGGIKVALLLMALASGYGVLVLSNKVDRPLDVLGRIVGGVILIVSFLCLICTAICSFRCMPGSCPFSSQSTPTQP